jgi:hypothetical protein
VNPDQTVTLHLNGLPYGETALGDLRELRVDFNGKDWDIHCIHCRSIITRYADGWHDWNDATACGGPHGDATLRPHTPEPSPIDWCERALIMPDVAGDSITVRIDLPGAAFCLTLRRQPDDTLTLHLPHPDHASARKLIEQAPGIYEIRD